MSKSLTAAAFTSGCRNVPRDKSSKSAFIAGGSPARSAAAERTVPRTHSLLRGVFAPRGAEDKSLLHFIKEKKMSKSFKAAAAIAVAAMFLAAPVFAQPSFGPSSPTGTATADVFTTDVEDSMDVHYYSGVEFDKWAGFVGIDGGLPSLGYATRFGDIYLGTWYNGNIAGTNGSVEHKVVSNYSLSSQLLTGKETTLTYSSKSTDSDNHLSVLLGVAGMGIKVGFAEKLTVWGNPDNARVITQDANGVNKTYADDYIADDYSRVNGYMAPYLQWGMSLEAGDLVINPKFGFAFGIVRDTNILNTKGNEVWDNTDPSDPVLVGYEYDTINGNLVGTERTNSVNGKANDYLAPRFTVGAGIDLSSGATIGIEYGLGFDIYNNSYDGSGFKGSVPGTVSWEENDYHGGAYTTIVRNMATTTTTTNGTLDIVEKTNWEHSITPSFYYSTDEIGVYRRRFPRPQRRRRAHRPVHALPLARCFRPPRG